MQKNENSHAHYNYLKEILECIILYAKSTTMLLSERLFGHEYLHVRIVYRNNFFKQPGGLRGMFVS